MDRLDLPAAAEKKEREFHEKDLDQHLATIEESGRKNAVKTGEPGLPATPDQETARDYQLVRALELVRGLGLMQNIR